MLDPLRQDLRYAVRALASHRLFAAAAILMLALGIGANSAMFALADAVLLRPLPFPDPDRLVKVWETTPQAGQSPISPGNVPDWNQRSATLERVAAYVPNVASMVMANADGSPETIPRQWVSSGIFDVLGITPVAGRTFTPEDDEAGRPAVILTESFWRTRFAGDPALVGQPLRLDGDAWLVVGVVPDSAQVIGRTSMWALATNRFPPTAPPQLRRVRFAHAIGRMKAGVSIDAAQSDMTTVASALARDYPATNSGIGVTIEPLADAVFGRDLRLTSLLFLAIVGLVLLICCANIANLLLTRATIRQRELAVRAAIGATSWRVVRQLLAESLVLAAAGGMLGVAVGAAILAGAPSVMPPDLLPATVALSLNGRIAAFCAITTLVVAVVFGLAPAWHSIHLPLAEVIASGTRTTPARGARARAGLVTAQVATAVVMLVDAGLLLRTLLNLNAVDRGYGAESVLSMMVDPAGGDPDGLLRFYDDIEREIRTNSGVKSVAWATTLPMGESYQGNAAFQIVGDPSPPPQLRPVADFQIVSPSYFETLELPIVDGRGFDDRDRRGAPPVCLVNEALGRRYFGGRGAVGARLAFGASPDGPQSSCEIVGVVRQVKGRPDETEDFLQIYTPLAQNTPGDIFLFVRPTSGRADSLARPVVAAIGTVDTQQLTSVRNIQTLEDIASIATSRYRFRAMLVVTFAGLALVLAMVGVFGVLAYSVEQRVRDFGVRRALGATTANVLGVVARSATLMIAAGAVVGGALSFAAGRLLASLLFGVRPLDAATLALVALVLTVTAAAAVLAPAMRAVRIDPMTALRSD